MSYRIQARPISPGGGTFSSATRSPKAVLRSIKYRPGTCLLIVLLGAFGIWLASIAMRRFSPFQRQNIFDLEVEMRHFEHRDSIATVLAYRHLILVPGHSVFTGFQLDAQSVRNESNWNLASYQIQNHQLQSYLRHVEEGVKALHRIPDSVLVFSGGQTTTKSGPRSEAASYLMALDALQFFGLDATKLRPRILLEEFSLDSFQNLLFSICRFREFAGHFPEQITVFGLAFKRKRFEELHRVALRYPASQFRYVGISEDGKASQDPLNRDASVLSPEEGERVHSFLPFQEDLYGCTGSLRKKRTGRNPYKNWHGIFGYQQVCPEIKDLFEYCGNGRTIYSGRLPWDPANR